MSRCSLTRTRLGFGTFLRNGTCPRYVFCAGLTRRALLRGRTTSLLLLSGGPEPLNADDWLSDINYHQRKLLPSVPGLVHGGFAVAIAEVIQATLDAVAGPTRGEMPRIFITGHSLGGALAVLAAAVLHFEARRRIGAVYTYG